MQLRSYLFIHQNMPAQFYHLCLYLRSQGNKIVFVTRNEHNQLVGVEKVRYSTTRVPKPQTHPYLRSIEDGVLHGQAVYRVLTELMRTGYSPDVIIGHAGWGELMFVKDVFPKVPLLDYFEFFYNSVGQDVDFDPEFPSNIDAKLSLRIKNSVSLISAANCDWGVTPTAWQYKTFPGILQSKLSVLHEGVDTTFIKPNPNATFQTINGTILRVGQKIVTYVARNLEPYRGFHVFMRAIPAIQKQHPDAQIVIVGSDGVSYGAKLPEGDSYKKRMISEVEFDPRTVHFTGHLSSDLFRSVLQLSTVHVYLTYPFVLSWSLLEAMASGCVVVGSRTPPVEEVIVDGYNGILVDFFDIKALAERVNEVMLDAKRFAKMRSRARQTVVVKYDLHSLCLPRQTALIDHLID